MGEKVDAKKPHPVPVPSPQCHRFGAVKKRFVHQSQTLVSPTHPCCAREAMALLSEIMLLPPESSNKQRQTYSLQTAVAP